MENDDGEELHPRKRHKVTVACDRCRAKKVKCDSVRPVCGPCSRRKDASSICTWDNGDARSLQMSTMQILRLQKRVRELEYGGQPTNSCDTTSPIETERFLQNQESSLSLLANLSALERSPDESARQIYRAPAPPSNGSTQRQRQSVVPESSPVSNAATTRSSKNAASVETQSHAAASGMIGSLPDEGHSNEYFGGSSAGSFVRQVRAAVSQKLGSAGPHSLSPGILGPARTTGVSLRPSRAPVDFVLPPRRRADELMDVYWETVYPLYPYLDKSDTILKYRDLWTETAEFEEDPVFICELNVIFALSCKLIGESHQRENSANVFFERSKALLDPWRADSFQSIQVCLLLGQYFQSTNDPHQCWTVVGSAIRLAQSLGLHLPETSERASSVRERELQRKVWHGCILMDRITSMTYGRPPMIGKKLAAAVPLPVAVDEDRLAEPAPVLWSDRPSLMHFFVETLGLYEILYDVLVAFYSSSAAAETRSGEDRWAKYFGGLEGDMNDTPSVHAIDRRLNRWEANLPAHLKTEPGCNKIETNKYYARQAIIIRQRYLHIKLLALRPVLSEFVAAETGHSDVKKTFGGVLTQRIALQCAIVCVTVAQENIDLAYTRRAGDPTAVGPIAAWWYNVLFVYSSATVLVAGKLCPSVLAEISEDAISRSWRRAIEILEHYQTFGPVIKQLVAAQHVLFNTLPEHYSHPKLGKVPNQNTEGTAVGRQDLFALSAHQPALIESDMGGEMYANQSIDLDGAPPPPLSNNETFDYDFDFVFNSNDLSWLNSMPFEL